MGLIQDARHRVLVVTADEHTASMVRQALQGDGTYAWCGWATKPEQAFALAGELEADVVVTDVSLPGTTGCLLVANLLQAYPDMPVIVLTKRADMALAMEAVRLGVGAYLAYDDGLCLLVDALDKVMDGHLCFSDKVLEMMARELGRTRPIPKRRRPTPRSFVDSAAWEAAATITDDVLAELTPRESQVMSELARGHDNRTIGRHLGISDGTVATYIKRIRQKLGASTRNELISISSRLSS